MTKETITEADTLEGTLKLLIEKALDTTGNLVDFLSKETPEVIQQLLTWHMVGSFIWALSFIGCIILLLKYAKFCHKRIEEVERQSDKTDLFVLRCIAFVLTGLAGLGIILNLANCVKIWVAPKLYLLEYAADLVK